jgi:acyl-CoA oxidase
MSSSLAPLQTSNIPSHSYPLVSFLPNKIPSIPIIMAPTPAWVKQLKPSGPQGHELLAAERAKSSISVDKLHELLLTREVIERKQKILGILKSEKVFDKSQNYFSGRMERFEQALAREKKLQLLKRKHNWTLEEFRTAAELVSEPGPYGLHESMFKVHTC